MQRVDGVNPAGVDLSPTKHIHAANSSNESSSPSASLTSTDSGIFFYSEPAANIPRVMMST